MSDFLFFVSTSLFHQDTMTSLKSYGRIPRNDVHVQVNSEAKREHAHDNSLTIVYITVSKTGVVHTSCMVAISDVFCLHQILKKMLEGLVNGDQEILCNIVYDKKIIFYYKPLVGEINIRNFAIRW